MTAMFKHEAIRFGNRIGACHRCIPVQPLLRRDDVHPAVLTELPAFLADGAATDHAWQMICA